MAFSSCFHISRYFVIKRRHSQRNWRLEPDICWKMHPLSRLHLAGCIGRLVARIQRSDQLCSKIHYHQRCDSVAAFSSLVSPFSTNLGSYSHKSGIKILSQKRESRRRYGGRRQTLARTRWGITNSQLGSIHGERTTAHRVFLARGHAQHMRGR